MSKKLSIQSLAIVAASAAILSCNSNAATETAVISEGIRYCESTYPYKDGILIANFGTEELNPLNNEGKGYIVFDKNGKSETLVPADGNLSAPKGMFLKDNHLFICDVNKIVVYNLDKKGTTPLTIQFPEGHLFVNDLVASGNTLYASVTNTDRIFRIDISDLNNPSAPEEWIEIPGPNGLMIADGTMYVASYPADGNTLDKHVIYKIQNLNAPAAEKMIEVPGQYDGIAMSSDKKYIYVTNWTPAGLSRIDLASGKIDPVNVETDKPLIGPADITVSKGKIFIPDLPNSRVIVISE